MNRKVSEKEVENKLIIEEMIKIHEKVKGIYGYRRLTMNIRRKLGITINCKRIKRLMKVAGIECVIRKAKYRYKRSIPQHVAENILNRDFSAEKPNQKWLTDVTELKYGNGQKAYFSAILDIGDNTIVGDVLGHSNNNALVFQTLKNALKKAPGAKPMIHSDRGFQYTSNGFHSLLKENKMSQSMSRVGRCIDNGPMEGFWGILKSEMYYLNKFSTFDELKKAIDEYIYFYNFERYQEKLNSLSPMEYRSKAV